MDQQSEKTSIRRVSMSLRYKMLAVLTLIPLIALGLYLLLATQLFEKDKEAYVYDSSVAVSKSLSTQIRVEVDAFMGRVKPIIEGYDPTLKAFSPQAMDFFLKFPRLSALLLYQGDPSGTYEKLGEMINPTSGEVKLLTDSRAIEYYRLTALHRGMVIEAYPNETSGLVISSRLGEVTDPHHLVFVALYRADTLFSAFGQSALYQSFLIDSTGRATLGAGDLRGSPLEGENLQDFFKQVISSKTPEGSMKLRTSTKKDTLVSYADVGISDMKVASVVDRRAALKAVDILVAKSLLFFAALLAATLLISLIASFRLTSTLRELYEATRRIAQGRFDIRIRSDSSDEIGSLADSFNVMAGEVSRLLSETAEKARMESELATVRTVQETLFPPTESKFGPVHIVGHFEPASECGGDWWNYSRVSDTIYLWIGDATGHGAPAALITSAARSAAAVIESLDNMSPGRALQIMNRAIHETSKGKINMTFFLAAIDEKSGHMTYANASHDPPFLIRKPEGRAVTKKDLVPLMDVNGRRLGERMDSVYEEAQLQLEKGDTIVFYTDGIIDLQDSSGKKWGERIFLKNIVEAVSGDRSLPDKMSFLRRSIAEFRGEAVLLDDITLFMCDIEDAA